MQKVSLTPLDMVIVDSASLAIARAHSCTLSSEEPAVADHACNPLARQQLLLVHAKPSSARALCICAHCDVTAGCGPCGRAR